jgi:hypothetical protein
MEATKQRKWALKFEYAPGRYQYAGQQFDGGYEGVGRHLTKAALFNSQQEALQHMMRTYGGNVSWSSVYPVPVPVIVATKTVTEIYEEDSINDPD